MLQPLRLLARRAGTRQVHLRTGAVANMQKALPSSTRLTENNFRPLHHLAAAARGEEARSWLAEKSQVRTVFIQTENTPNPESIKFVPSGRVVLESEDGTGYFVQKNDSMEDILKSPLATQLFKIDGVKAVYLGFDFVTITKYAENNWYVLKLLQQRQRIELSYP